MEFQILWPVKQKHYGQDQWEVELNDQRYYETWREITAHLYEAWKNKVPLSTRKILWMLAQ